jgi:BirA family biotin operon repressor/biotin-[acetyl-CoA-carboxylase] ligase
MSAIALAVLRLLNQGDIHSSAQLAQAMAVSEAEMRSAIRYLRAEAVPLVSVRGRGYRLTQPIDLLDHTEIAALLQQAHCPIECTVLDDCDSTNTRLLDDVELAAPHALICERQYDGRGRRARSWHTGLAEALSFSLLWSSARPPRMLNGLSLAIGVACIRALKESGIDGIVLKWPNDLLFRGAKLGGILIEMQRGIAPTRAVIGIGLNTHLRRDLSVRFGRPISDLHTAATAPLPTRNRLFATLLVHLCRALAEFEADGFAVFLDEWLAHHAYQGQLVRLSDDAGRTVEGLVQGVAEDGALLLRTDAGLQRFISGDLSLRLAA